MSHPQSAINDIERFMKLLPAYEFEQLIAEDSESLVYRARQKSLDRDVAIKILPSSVIQDSDAKESFLRNSKAMARLVHPNLIRVFDSGEIEGMLFVVMEYVHGRSLAYSTEGRVIEPRQAVEIIRSVCEAFDHAQQNGLVFQGIDAGKILLNQQCEPKISTFDFSEHQTTGLTQNLASGSSHELDQKVSQSVVRSVGLILCEMLTGSDIESFQSGFTKINNPRLAAIVKKATDENSTASYESARALADELIAWTKAASSRLLTTAGSPPKAMVRKPATQAAKKIHVKSSSRPSVRMLVGKCAAIAFLLCAIHFLWGAYQAKKETIAKLQEIENSKPPVLKVIRLEAKPTTVNTIVSKTSHQALNESEALASSR